MKQSIHHKFFAVFTKKRIDFCDWKSMRPQESTYLDFFCLLILQGKTRYFPVSLSSTRSNCLLPLQRNAANQQCKSDSAQHGDWPPQLACLRKNRLRS